MIRLFVLAIIVATVGFVVYQMISFLVAINSTKSQKKRDADKLRQTLLDKKNHLVKLSDDELELLSINITDTSTVPGLNPEKYGVFTSIYHEPLISFARKVYGAGNESVTVVITSQHEFVYHSAASKTQVTVDGHVIGVVHADGNLYDSKNRLVAHIDADDVLASHPVKVGAREVGEIINPMLASSPNPRAYTFLKPMDSDEKILFMSLTLLSLVEESV